MKEGVRNVDFGFRVALSLDEPALADVDVERIGKNVDAVEADLLRHANAVGRLPARLRPRGIDESQFHGGVSWMRERKKPEDRA